MYKHILIMAAIICCQFTLLGTNVSKSVDGNLVGFVVDKTTKQPIEYANIAIYNTNDELISGGITDERGHFAIKGLQPGEYYMVAKFIGFDGTRIESLLLTDDARRFNLGTVELEPSISQLEGVEVVAEKRAIQYKIDKKVINPSQYLASAGGTAVDILANTPSITVDVEGNVTMRGSSNFTVLIDGKPTPFESSDALEQVPASQIENIEIITNPSVKYDPDGTAGIINIVTKRNRLRGVSGIFNFDANTIGSVGGDFLLNFQREKFDFFVGGNRSDRKHRGFYTAKTTTFLGDTIFYNNQNGDGGRGFTNNTIKTGFNYHFDKKTTLSLNLSGGFRERRFFNEVDYTIWNTTDGFESPKTSSRSTSDNTGGGLYFSGDISFDKKFEKDGHEILTTFFYQLQDSEEKNINEEDFGTDIIDGLRSWEVGNGREMRFKTDYTLPVNSFITLESGYQWRMDDDYEWYDLVNYTSTDFDYNPGPNSANYKTSDYVRQIHSLYATIGGEWGRLGYKGGLRGEYTFRELIFSGSPESYKIDRLDLFPSIHLSYSLPSEFQLMASYSKRIERPRSYYLEPFETWMNAYSVRKGNPAIQPEYIDSYELGFQKSFQKGFFSMEAFYRYTDNRIDRIQSLYIFPETGDTSTNIILQESANSGKDYALGLESMVNYDFNTWWSINTSGQLFNYRVESTLNDQVVERESLNWGLRMSNTFKPFKNNRVQFDVMYRSKSITFQGTRDGFAFTNLSVRQDLFNRSLSVTLSAQDLFKTAKFKMKSEGPNFVSERTWKMDSPVFQIQLSYKLNNFMQERGRPGGDEGGGGMDMDGGF